MAQTHMLFLLLKDGEVLRWLGAVDKFERIGNDGRITSMATSGGALFLLLNDGKVLRWLGAVDKFERIGNDGRITSMAAAGGALFLLFKDGQVLRWLGAVDQFERIGNDGRITSMATSGGALFLLLNDGKVLRWLGAVDKFERIGNDGRITSMAAAGGALFLLFNDGQVLRWLGAVDQFERIGNDGRITSMAAAGGALFLLFKDGQVLRWLGAVDQFERIGNDGRITSMAAAAGALFLHLNDGEVLRWLGAVDRFERIGNDGRITSMAADVDIANAIEQKYLQIGGRQSPLGRSLDSHPSVQPDGRTSIRSFAGGQIKFTSENGASAFVTHRAVVRYKGIHAFGISEATDEPYAIVGVYAVDARDKIVVRKFPIGRDSYTNFKPGTDESASEEISLDLAPQALAIVSTVMERDSGDPDRVAAKVEDSLKKAAIDAGADPGQVSVFTGILDDLGIPGLIADLLGVGDDLIGIQTLQFNLTDLIPKRPMQQFGNISFNFESPLLSDGDASYKLFYEVFVQEIQVRVL